MEKVKVLSLKPITSNNNESETFSSVVDLPSSLTGQTYNFFSERATKETANVKTCKNSFGPRGSSFSISASAENQNLIRKNRVDKADSSLKDSSQNENSSVTSEVHNQTSGIVSSTKSSGNFFPVSTNCFGRSDVRASYSERIRSGPSSLQPFSTQDKTKKLDREAGNDFVFVKGSGLYRSNSSLELDHDTITEEPVSSQTLRREYGSHGSIDVAASFHHSSIYSILQKYQQESEQGENCQYSESSSPKARSKIYRLWDRDKSIFKKFLSVKNSETKAESKVEIFSDRNSLGGVVITNCNIKHAETMTLDNKQDDINSNAGSKPMRRAAIAHYDCQSLAAQLNSSRLKNLLAVRCNTTTGASAAASADPESSQQASFQGSAEELRVDDTDRSDERSNLLVDSCPFFHTEIGGEGERIVSLSREVTRNSRLGLVCNVAKAAQLHRSSQASSIGLLESSASSSNVCQTLCPYVKKSPCIEACDQGSNYYSNYFSQQEHQNWFGVDDQLGPVAISVKKEKVEENAYDSGHSLPSYQYRFIIRTSEPYACQGSIREDSLNHRGEKNKGQGFREALEYVCPQLSFSCLRLGTNTPETEAALIKLDELGMHKKFKVGVLYCRSGQKMEEEMYNNENSGPAFSEFLEILGQRVRLKNFDKYRGGLDKRTDSTGNYSVYSQYQGCEIMFHVSTLLPFTPNNRKQLLRKRHIGNDIVTIIFQEPGAHPFSPKYIRSHFQHVFIVIQAVNPCTDNTMYSVAVSRFQDVPIFGPPIPENGTFPKSKQFADFLLAKVINGELAALRSDKFACMAARTKHEYLKDLAENHSSSTLLDTSSKFSLMGFSRSSKKEKSRFKFVAENTVKGALSWNLVIDDATLQQKVDCVVGISLDCLVVLEESSASVIFAASCKSILGWTLKSKQGIRLFYHQGESLSFGFRSGTSEVEGEEILNEIVARLSAITQGAQTLELVLKRNSAGLLGFNVQQDGIITEVEPYGLAAQAQLQPGARLLEICTIALATLTQEQMVDLLKTSVTVSVTIIPPHKDGMARRGCNVPTCGFLLGCSEGDYENLTPPEQMSSSHPKNRVTQLSRYDRSLSPPHSGSSSGYGTGSSSHSFSMEQNSNRLQPLCQDQGFLLSEDAGNSTKDKVIGDLGRPSEHTNTLSSTSSGHSTDMWSELTSGGYCTSSSGHNPQNTNPSLHRQLLHNHVEQQCSPPPPPLPARLYKDKRDALIDQRKKHSNKTNHSDASSEDLRMGDKMSLSSATPFPSYENGNYAVPLSLPRPVPKEYLTLKFQGSKTESYYSDYDNAPVRSEHQKYLQPKQSLRRNSSPQATNLKEESDDAVSKEYLMKARHSVPKNANPEEKAFEENPTIIRSEDELSASSGGSPLSFQKLRTIGGSNSSPSLYSQTQSPPHGTNYSGQKVENAAPAPVRRLKQGVYSSKYSANRSSASSQSTTLQEELLKLINPDYLSDSESIGAEIREKKESLLNRVGSGATAEAEVPSTKVPAQNDHCSSRNALDTLSSSSASTTHTSGTADNVSSLGSDLYECVNTPYHTIGEVEFSNRKSVFTRSGRRVDGPEQKLKHELKEKEVKKEKLPTKAQSGEGVLLTARPATVISNPSTASSPATFENRDKANSDVSSNREDARGKEMFCSSSENSQSAHVFNDQTVVCNAVANSANSNLEFINPDINEEWSSLVSTATLAIEKSGDILACSTLKKEKTCEKVDNGNDAALPNNRSISSSQVPGTEEVHYESNCYNISKGLQSHQHPNNYYATSPQPEPSDPNGNEAASSVTEGNLHEQLQHLERALMVEQQRSGQLQEEVSYLRNENRKLQDDSRAAAHQLHQFTEWFFNTIDKG